MSATQTKTSTWVIDSAHSAGDFAIKHMMISTVRGHFKITEGQIVVNEENHTASSVSATIDPKSLNTREEKRDAHLQSGDFFEADKYPTITFQSTRVQKVNDTNWKVFGDLTLHGVTNEIVLYAEVAGTDVDPWGNDRVGLEITGQLSRESYGMKFNQALGSGNMLVGDKVKLALDVSAIRQA